MNKKLAILGAGESGFGSAVLGVSKGFDVFLSDNGKIKSKYKYKSTSTTKQYVEISMMGQ